MSRARRLDRLEESVAKAAHDPDLCNDCDPDEGRRYRRGFDFMWLTERAAGKLGWWQGSPDEARATIREMLTQTPPEADRCRQCDDLTDTGWLRKHRAELGLDG